MLDGLPGWPFVKPAGGWSMLLDVSQLGFEPEDASRILLEDAQIAATGMRGWGGGSRRALRTLRLQRRARRAPAEIPDRVAGTKLAAAVATLA